MARARDRRRRQSRRRPQGLDSPRSSDASRAFNKVAQRHATRFVKENSELARRRRQGRLGPRPHDLRDARRSRKSAPKARKPRASTQARARRKPPDPPPVVRQIVSRHPVRPGHGARCFFRFSFALSERFHSPVSVISISRAPRSVRRYTPLSRQDRQTIRGPAMATAPQSFATLPALSPAVADWVESVRQLTTPDRVHWCDGSAAELARLKQGLEKTGELKQLNQTTFPGCHIAHSHPVGRGARRAPDLHLHQEQGRRRPEQQLDGARTRRAPRCARCSRAA